MLLAILAVLRLVFEEVPVPARLTHPSSGRATAGFARRVPPLMSNVRHFDDIKLDREVERMAEAV